SAYQPLGAAGAIASPQGRYLQYQLAFTGSTTAAPSVSQVTVTFGSGVPTATATMTPTGTPVPTSTPIATATNIPTATNTPTPTPTATATAVSTPSAPGQFAQGATDFAQGTKSGVAVGVDGDLSLIPAFSDDFSGTILNSSAWSMTKWSPPDGSATVSGGAV